ncbi:DUF3987 domain-containing protein [Falsiroseomonas sp. E2-1-a20]|uniref:DUF3987 domain-containing protein n=1 Tax=Falsiroseomonas sp. E2-1-a20 TaxID=3239300 RepID=UPI003F2A4771
MLDSISASPPSHSLAPDAATIARFVDATFRYADAGTYASLRAFRDNDDGPPYRIAVSQIGESLDALVADAERMAAQAGATSYATVFAPPVATFTSAETAKEADLANGLTLSVECDAAAHAARAQLVALLGPATVVVASGGEWLNASTGELEPKLHLHWRLTEPTRTQEEHATLKRARVLAARLVGADPTNAPMVHPIRWPGSWHRKGAPKLARIVDLTDREIDLAEALERLQEAAAVAGLPAAPNRPGAAPEGTGEARDTAALVQAIRGAEDYHAATTALAMRFLKGGMPDGQAVMVLRGLMQAVPESERDLKDGTAQPGRWQARYDDIPRAVSTARAKIGERPAAEPGKPVASGGEWPEPINFLADVDLTAAPMLQRHHLPDVLADFAFDTAGRMGVDPSAVALAEVVACASVISDDWRLQPKIHDTTWTENARIWGAIVGDPSILKTPVIKAVTAPIDVIDAQARDRHAEAMRTYRSAVATAKADKTPPEAWPPMPKLDRHLIEGTTVEALSEALRDDDEAKQRAPAGKVMVRQDELSEWLASFDSYRGGGKGGADRGAYLRLYNGGRFVVDRIGRGTFAIPNWSACVLGGVQPEPIQRIARDAADDGLLQRFCYVVPAAQGDGEDREPDQKALARYHALFPVLSSFRPSGSFPGAQGRPVVLHAKAHDHRLAIDQLIKAQVGMPDTSSRLKAAFGKWRGLFARIALTFHLVTIADARARGEQAPVAEVLSEDTARRAEAFMRGVLLPHLLRAEGLLFLTPQTGHSRWIAGHILASEAAQATGRITLRDVTRAYQPLRSPERRRELLACMEALETMAWLLPEVPANPARQPAAWAVNPKLYTILAAEALAERERRKQARAEVTEAARRNRQESPR